jgi:hypothetical protein
MAEKKTTVAKKTTTTTAKGKRPVAKTAKKKPSARKKTRARRSPAAQRSELGKAYHQLFEAHAALQRTYIDELKTRADSMVEKGRKTARKEIAALEKNLKKYRTEYKRKAKDATKIGEASWADTKTWFSAHSKDFDNVVKKLTKIKIT